MGIINSSTTIARKQAKKSHKEEQFDECVNVESKACVAVT